MKFSEGIPVDHATLHNASPVKYATTEQTLSPAKIPGMEMALFPQGLVVKVKNKAGQTGYTLFPSAAVKTMYIAMEEERPSKIDKK